MPNNDEELVIVRLKKNTWYRAIPLGDPIALPKLPEEFRRHGFYVRLSHNDYNFRPGHGRGLQDVEYESDRLSS